MDKRSKTIPASWAEPLERFCQSLAAAGRSSETVKLRRAHVAQLARGVDVGPLELDVEGLVAYLAGRTWSRESRRAVRASLRAWWLWLGRPEMLEAVPSVRAAAPVPRPAPDDALVEALARADARTRLMLRLAAELGLRRGEIARVHVQDLGEDLLGPTLRVRGKGSKVRTMPVTGGLAAEVRLAASVEGWLFPGDDGGHLSPKWVGTLMARALPAPWTAHTLRHRWATRAYAATSDLMAVSRLLGHASVATTQRYVATDAARLRAVAAAAA